MHPRCNCTPSRGEHPRPRNHQRAHRGRNRPIERNTYPCQGLRALVDQHVVIKLHVIDLIIGGEGKCLGADFHSDRLSLRFRCAHVAFIIENPVVGFGPRTAELDLLDGVQHSQFLAESRTTDNPLRRGHKIHFRRSP